MITPKLRSDYVLAHDLFPLSKGANEWADPQVALIDPSPSQFAHNALCCIDFSLLHYEEYRFDMACYAVVCCAVLAVLEVPDSGAGTKPEVGRKDEYAGCR